MGEREFAGLSGRPGTVRPPRFTAILTPDASTAPRGADYRNADSVDLAYTGTGSSNAYLAMGRSLPAPHKAAPSARD